MKSLNPIVAIVLGSFLVSCVASQPANIANICEIFEDRRGWYRAAKQTQERWAVPIPVSMAFIYQESGFRARARPERNRFLWIFPGRRPSSAFGYAQAVDSTWEDYIVQSNNWNARRDNFADAIDFIGWYNAMSRRMNNIDSYDAANLYFAYHEGNGGFARSTYRQKPWLLSTGSKVQENASRFEAQYASCREDLEKNWFQRLFT